MTYRPVQLAHIYLEKRKKCDRDENLKICSEKCVEQNIKSPLKSEWSFRGNRVPTRAKNRFKRRLYLANGSSHVKNPNTKIIVHPILHNTGSIHFFRKCINFDAILEKWWTKRYNAY